MSSERGSDRPPPRPLAPGSPAGVAQADVAAAVEAERRRLAGLLQSNVVEPLNLLLAQANAYERTPSADPTARMAVSVLVSLARQALQQVRDLETSLHPTILETLGLEPALEVLASQAMRSHGLRINLALERMRQRLPHQLELALYRAAQDVLDRAIRHVHASQVTIRLEHRDEQLVFGLSDNGVATTGPEMLHATYQRIEQLGAAVETRPDAHGNMELSIVFTPELPVQLTPRETEVIQLLAEGLKDKEIARQLTVSPRTVNFHLNNIYSKLGVSSRTEAAIYALRQGWANPVK